MTIREAFNINPKVELALYSSQIDLNLAVYHQFSLDGRGHAQQSPEHDPCSQDQIGGI